MSGSDEQWSRCGQGLGARDSTFTAPTDGGGSLGGGAEIRSHEDVIVPRHDVQKLLGEFRALHQERLQRLEATDDGTEETLKLKVQIMQSYISDLSEQNDVLLQTMEELEREANRRVTALETELEEHVAKVTEYKEENSTLLTTKENLAKEIALASATVRAMPTEHLSGSTATLPPNTGSSEIFMKYEEIKSELEIKEQMIQRLHKELTDATFAQQLSKDEVVDKDKKIQELQDIITELHNDVALKDAENLNQLQDIHLLESNIKALNEELGSPHKTFQKSQVQSFRSNNLLKAELERRDGTILHLRKEVLQLQEKRDRLTCELDIQEQRIYQLQGELKEGVTELKKKQGCLQQLQEELLATRNQYEEAQKQLAESNGFLSQVKAENQTLKVYKLEQSTEIEALTATIQNLELSATNVNAAFTAEAAQKHNELVSTTEELKEKLAETQAELSQKDDATQKLKAQLQNTSQWAEETKLQLKGVQAAIETMKNKYTVAENEMIKLEQTIKQLKEERVRLQQHCHELVEENERLHAQLEAENLAMESEQNVMSMELNIKESLIHKLKKESIALQDKAKAAEQKIFQLEMQIEHLNQQLESTEAVKVTSDETIHSLERQLREYRTRHEETAEEVNRCEDTIRQLNGELSSIQIVQDSTKRSIEVKEETIQQLTTETEILQNKLKECQTRMLEMEEQLNATDFESDTLRDKLQNKAEEVQQLTDQFREYQEAQHQVTNELDETRRKANNEIARREEKNCTLQKHIEDLQYQYTSCYSELLHNEDDLAELKCKFAAVNEELSQQAVTLSNVTLEKQKLDTELSVLSEKNTTAQREVNSRDQTILKLKSELKTAQENVKSAWEEVCHSAKRNVGKEGVKITFH
ncbi:early endosome antigen 1-like [Callorhinchus milii]|nr:early endosome antigen 1-like [Callorhinchus milii]